jgi:hypothetical protein
VNNGAALPAALRQIVFAASAEAAYIKYLVQMSAGFSKVNCERSHVRIRDVVQVRNEDQQD